MSRGQLLSKSVIVLSLIFASPSLFAFQGLYQYARLRHHMCEYQIENWPGAMQDCRDNGDCSQCLQLCDIENRFDCYQEPDQDPNDPDYVPDQLDCESICQPSPY